MEYDGFDVELEIIHNFGKAKEYSLILKETTSNQPNSSDVVII